MGDQQLIDQYIESNPDRPGPAEARIRGYGVSVWALAGYYEAVRYDVDRVARDYYLPREAVEAAIAFYRRYKDIIDSRRGATVD